MPEQPTVALAPICTLSSAGKQQRTAYSDADRGRLRKGSAAERAFAVLPHYPIVTIGRLASILDVGFPAASSAIARACGSGHSGGAHRLPAQPALSGRRGAFDCQLSS
jgi:hypothetical protein